MSKDIMRMKMVLPVQQFNRIKEDCEEGFVVDVHEFHRDETKTMINNMINLTTHPCKITVIHGFNRGTVLQQTIRTAIKNPRIQKISTASHNPGLTILDIA